MSQISTMAGDGQSHASKAPTGRAVLLLAVAVILGIALLHELDDTTASISGDEAAQQATQQTQQGASQLAQSTTSTIPLRTPADIKVLVANGTNVNGAAAKVASRLQPVGYQLLKPGNTTRNDYTASGVQYAEGFQAEAQALATALGIPAASVQPIPLPAPLTDLQAANILVVVGNDLASSTTQQTTAQQQSATLNNALNGPLTQGNNTTTSIAGGTSTGVSAQSSSGGSSSSNSGSVTITTTQSR